MKKTICAILYAMLPVAIQAQTDNDSITQHLDFMGVSMEGNIDDFTQRMQPRFRFKKRVRGENQVIFEGSMFGYNVFARASYTRKTRTVYRMLITPKNINQIAWVDSLTARYGMPVETRQGLLFQRPGGMILYYTPEGYDTALIYLDAKGNEAFTEEK